MEKQLFNFVVSFYTEKNRSLTFLSKRLFLYSNVGVISRLEFESRRYARSYEVILREQGRKEKVVFSYEEISDDSPLPDIPLMLPY
jgi:hypothetical protein